MHHFAEVGPGTGNCLSLLPYIIKSEERRPEPEPNQNNAATQHLGLELQHLI
jgi:hypothetical protein